MLPSTAHRWRPGCRQCSIGCRQCSIGISEYTGVEEEEEEEGISEMRLAEEAPATCIRLANLVKPCQVIPIL
eukprot:1160901-Pelagomonas_calceolata.AAC.2